MKIATSTLLLAVVGMASAAVVSTENVADKNTDANILMVGGEAAGCNGDADCPKDYHCSGNFCIGLLDPGVFCRGHIQCKSGRCDLKNHRCL
ncbi:hypothetical protein ASPWEDRAFT_43530 [Aspergillus wentii DTO 134E9]|uniref:Dickkopf N-terminal cysteine-rich domain-containing protein n=1 Tax=Aspergillus wentii DTO 134E9 TaxID=1073089 RepID=A0A1L9RF17_ASPWE|nr:uncharacterized protein ASPWEDRAFT_43530 [Aspergillus wentii DTO 134E9]KAI9926148.1 hypothetical protein MW887_004611 [Aspergillus wentii]OJJ33468.1 hypothetical protein ASPWEDRAFT_43530 [Aspergillus wentii DTO 134E9]